MESFKFLGKIKSPSDLKKLSLSEMKVLASELREKIIQTTSATGGHVAPNLGTVEFTIALHYVFDSPNDKIIWDVGHQTYPHKLLTGRFDRFDTLRQYKGISGFPKRCESEHDFLETGHSSTSLSASLGLAIAEGLSNSNNKIIAIIGDGAMTAGMAFEALNQIGHLKPKNLIIILNDNAMSISKNVGAVSEYLSKIISGRSYNTIKDDIEDFILKIPNVGDKVMKAGRKIQESVKHIFIPGSLFENFGLRYFGPVDGHSLEDTISMFYKIKEIDGPILLHLLTKKGKGFHPAESDPTKFHGLGQFDLETGESTKPSSGTSYSKLFGETLTYLAKKDEKIIAITAAMAAGTGLDIFADELPDQFFDVGIAEQHAITFAAGLAIGGYKPVAAIYSSFMQRCYDQVIHDVALQHLPVKIFMDRAGLVGEDGETHQGMFDISFMRAVPDLVFMSPKDGVEFQDMIYTSVKYEDGPVAVRFPRGNVPNLKDQGDYNDIEIGKAEVLREGKDVMIFAIGNMVLPSIEIADALKKQGVDAGVVNARFIKPIDKDLIIKYVKAGMPIATLEDNTLVAGFGSAVLEVINDSGLGSKNVINYGLPDKFIEHGSVKQLFEMLKLDNESIVKKIVEFLK